MNFKIISTTDFTVAAMHHDQPSCNQTDELGALIYPFRMRDISVLLIVALSAGKIKLVAKGLKETLNSRRLTWTG